MRTPAPVVLAVGLLALGAPAFAYEAGPVTHGGIVSGSVKLDGPAPVAPVLKLTKNQSHCGATVANPIYDASPDGGLRNVEVFFKKVEKGKPLATDAVTLTNAGCMFHPRVFGATSGGKITVNSSDPISHNTHLQLFSDGTSLGNFALPFKGFSVDKTLPLKPGLVRVKCDIHEWMRAWIWVFDHPYFTTTDDAGRFSIADVPPGEYVVVAWHEELGRTELPVRITAEKTATLEFHFAGKK